MTEQIPKERFERLADPVADDARGPAPAVRQDSGQAPRQDAPPAPPAGRRRKVVAVLILAALAAAALLILIVVGTLTSDMTEEIGQPKFGHIGQTVR